MKPFLLHGAEELPPESTPSTEEFYDLQTQLWTDRSSGKPLVSLMQSSRRVSADNHQNGEPFSGSQFGETILTKTQEGADQTERASIEQSRYGETTLTATQEGTDKTEVSCFEESRFGETTLTETREGVDQSEITAFPKWDAANNHIR